MSQMSAFLVLPAVEAVPLIDNAERTRWLHPLWKLLQQAYRDVKGGLHYSNPHELLETSHEWLLGMHEGNVIAALIFEPKKGRKIVALAADCSEHQRERAIMTLGHLLHSQWQMAWSEVSEKAEKFALRNGGDDFRIPNRQAGHLTGKPILDFNPDGFHYTRLIMGQAKEKLMLGTPIAPRFRCTASRPSRIFFTAVQNHEPFCVFQGESFNHPGARQMKKLLFVLLITSLSTNALAAVVRSRHRLRGW